MRAHLPVIFSLKEARSWDVPDLGVAWLCLLWWQIRARHFGVFGLFFPKKRDLGGLKTDVQLFFSGPFLSWPCMHLTAKKTWDVHETFIKNVIRVLWEGRRA